jgi:hypothetical protein
MTHTCGVAHDAHGRSSIAVRSYLRPKSDQGIPLDLGVLGLLLLDKVSLIKDLDRIGYACGILTGQDDLKTSSC